MEEIDLEELYYWLCDANDALFERNLSREEVENILNGNAYLLHCLIQSIPLDPKNKIIRIITRAAFLFNRCDYLLFNRPKTDKNLELLSRLTIDMWFFIRKVFDSFPEDFPVED
jgi:hypothetical protein